MNITWLIQVCVFLGLIAYRIKKKNVEEKKRRITGYSMIGSYMLGLRMILVQVLGEQSG